MRQVTGMVRSTQSVSRDGDLVPRRTWLAAIVLAGIVVTVYLPALSCKFIIFNDPAYVVDNPLVTHGFSRAGLIRALAELHQRAWQPNDRPANWHPLTWLSFRLDATVSKLAGTDSVSSRVYHLANILLHAANTALVLLALRSLTEAFWSSFAVALLFGVLPLRLDSVAWISEPKLARSLEPRPRCLPRQSSDPGLSRQHFGGKRRPAASGSSLSSDRADGPGFDLGTPETGRVPLQSAPLP